MVNTYENAIYTGVDKTVIKVDMNGVTTFIEAIISNTQYKEMMKLSISIDSYDSKMDLDEYRIYRNGEMNKVDVEKASATQLDDMTSPEVTDTKNWKQDMRDSPQDQTVINGIALLDKGDNAGAIALMPTKPSIIA